MRTRRKRVEEEWRNDEVRSESERVADLSRRYISTYMRVACMDTHVM